MKRLGPELKMPDLKPPAFLADLYYDLRDRRLLPLIALIVVAIAAVPFLLGGDSEALPEGGVAAEAGGVPGAGGAEISNLTVVEATPGLRDYRKRLRRQTPTDPFAQQYTTSGGGGSGEGEGEGGASSGGSSGVTDIPSGSGSETDGGTPPGYSGGDPSGGEGEGEAPRLIAFVVDVQISHSEETADGRQKMGEPKVYRKVRPLTQLPGKKAPVVTTMGINLHTTKVMFLVSDEVKSLDGDFTCVARTPADTCELLEIEPGFPFDLVYGPNEVRYRLKVTKVGAVRAGRVGDGKSSRAALEAEYGAAFAVR